MKKNYYVDSIMGSWVHDKKASSKTSLVYKRRAEVILHKDNAILYTDPTDFKQYHVYGPVVLTESKLLEIATGVESLFRNVELLTESKKEKIY